MSASERLSSLETAAGWKSVLVILVVSGHREDDIQTAPFMGMLRSPKFTILLTDRGTIFSQMSPPQPRWHSPSFRNEACFPAEIQTAAPRSSAWRVDALEIWLALHQLYPTMCSSIPICGLPFGCGRFSATCSYQDGNMLGVQRVAHTSAVFLPKVIIVNLNCGLASAVGFCREDLTIDGCVFCLYCWVLLSGRKFSRHPGAVCLTDHEKWSELRKECLFKIVSQPILIGINRPCWPKCCEATSWALKCAPDRVNNIAVKHNSRPIPKSYSMAVRHKRELIVITDRRRAIGACGIRRYKWSWALP